MQLEPQPTNSTLMTLEIKRQRPQALSACLDLFNSVLILRDKWAESGYYERIQIEQRAKYVKQQYTEQKKQYKIYTKAGLDEFSQEVVNSLF